MVRKAIFETLIPVLLVVLAADLLYLYFMGAWYDPNLLMLISELIALPLCIVLGVWGTYHSIRENRKGVLKGRS